jgi:hypothetical protein
MLSAEIDQHSVENQDRERMAAGKTVASLADQMKGQVRPGTMEGELQRLLEQGSEDRRRRYGNPDAEPRPGQQSKQQTHRGYGLPVAQIGDRREKGRQTRGPQAVNVTADRAVKNKRIPSNDEAGNKYKDCEARGSGDRSFFIQKILHEKIPFGLVQTTLIIIDSYRKDHLSYGMIFL